MQINTYEEFIERVENIGFIPMSKGFLPGFPSLTGATPDYLWHTGLETDPWIWKDRAAEEKKLAFGCILGGHKGFISQRLYSLFYSANNPYDSIEEQYYDGKINSTTYELWQLFESNDVLSTADIRKLLGVTKKSGASRVDTSMKELQKHFYITVCGNQRKISNTGIEFGWPANTYTKVTSWAPDNWFNGIDDLDKTDAREQILDMGVSIGENIDRDVLRKLLFR